MKLKYKVVDVVLILVALHILTREYVVFEDLMKTFEGRSMIEFALSRYQLGVVIIDFFGIWSVFLPFLVVYFIPTYKKYVDSRFIYNIGKRNDYNLILHEAKKKISFINCKIFTGILLVYLFISVVYSFVFNKFDEKNVEMITALWKPNLFYGYIISVITIYLYTYAILTLSENAKSIIMLIVLFIITYLFIGILSHRITSGYFESLAFSNLVGTDLPPLVLLASLVLPLILYIGAKYESKEMVVN